MRNFEMTSNGDPHANEHPTPRTALTEESMSSQNSLDGFVKDEQIARPSLDSVHESVRCALQRLHRLLPAEGDDDPGPPKGGGRALAPSGDCLEVTLEER